MTKLTKPRRKEAEASASKDKIRREGKNLQNDVGWMITSWVKIIVDYLHAIRSVDIDNLM